MLIGLCILGFYCFFASMLGSDFAKLHFSIPFLNFPVFIGEIVLLFCLILSGWIIYARKIYLTKPQCFFLAYLGYIILWVGFEYFNVNGSPLALRNAVLFFYPIFAFFSYSFYYPYIFSSVRVKVLLTVFFLLACVVIKAGFFSFIYFILFLAFLYAGVPRPWKYLFVAAAVFLCPYYSFLSGARTWLVASILTGLFLIFIFAVHFLKLSKAWRIMATLAVGAVFLCVALHFAERGGLKTLSSPMKVINGYRQVRALIKEKEPSFHSQSLTVHLYNDQSFNGNLYLYSAPFYNIPQPLSKKKGPPHRDVQVAYDDIYFRFLIWHDMIKELWEKKSVFGVGLAQPQRSRSIEILNWASGEWSRDGWITPHNSFLHLIYRAGIIGIGLIVVILMILSGLIRDFIVKRSVAGVLLSGIIIYGLAAANFLLILELPYYAIPFWSIFGLILAYRQDLLEGKIWAARKENI